MLISLIKVICVQDGFAIFTPTCILERLMLIYIRFTIGKVVSGPILMSIAINICMENITMIQNVFSKNWFFKL